MSEATDTRTLQLFYAGLMVDAASNFEHFGLADQVAQKKTREQALAALSQRGSGKPCDLYCIDPFRALAGALSPAQSLVVEETLWEGKRCRFRLQAILA